VPMTNTTAKAVILVGGEGTRLRPLTHEVPKPMVPVLNRPFLEHTLAYLKKYGINDVVLAMSYLPQAIRDYFGDGSAAGVKLAYAVEDNPRGTGGAVKNVEGHLDEAFVVLNGDVFSDIDIAEMLAFHRGKGAKVTIALTWVDDPCPFGVVETDAARRVERFVEKPSPDKVTSHWINAGIYIIEPEVLQHIPPDCHYMFEKGLFPRLLEMGEPVYGYPSSGYWLDMGTPRKYLTLNCDLLQSRAWSALVGFPPQDCEDGVCCGRDVVIHPLAGVLGPTVIGDGSRIGKDAVVRGPAVIGTGCRIGEGASLERVVLWGDVEVGAGAAVCDCILATGVRAEEKAQLDSRVVTASKTGNGGMDSL